MQGENKITFLSSVECEPPGLVACLLEVFFIPELPSFFPSVLYNSFNTSKLSLRRCNDCLMPTQASPNFFAASESISNMRLDKDLLSPCYVSGTTRCST